MKRTGAPRSFPKMRGLKGRFLHDDDDDDVCNTQTGCGQTGFTGNRLQHGNGVGAAAVAGENDTWSCGHIKFEDRAGDANGSHVV